MSKSEREPISEEHHRLGRLLRFARDSAKATMRQVPNYSSGHISNVENGHVTPSRELVDLYVSLFGCDHGQAMNLYSRMKAGSEQRRQDQRLAGKPAHRAPPVISEASPFAEIRSCYQIQEYEAYYLVDGTGVIRELHAIRKLSALYPGVRYCTTRFNYPADSQPNVISLHAGTGCEIARVQGTNTNYMAGVLRLSREINPADPPHLLSFSIRNTSDVIALPVISYYARSPVTRYSIRVFFTDSFMPQRIWSFRGTDRSAGDFEPEPESPDMLEPSSAGFYHLDFHNLNEEYAGLAWSWS